MHVYGIVDLSAIKANLKVHKTYPRGPGSDQMVLMEVLVLITADYALP